MKVFWSLLKVLILKTKQQQQQKPLFWFYFWSKWKCGSKTIQQIISDYICEQLFQRLIPLNISDQTCFLLIWHDIIRNYLQLKKPQHIEQFSERWEMNCWGGSLKEATTQVLDCSECMMQLIFSIIQAKQSPFHTATTSVLKIWC